MKAMLGVKHFMWHTKRPFQVSEQRMLGVPGTTQFHRVPNNLSCFTKINKFVVVIWTAYFKPYN